MELFRDESGGNLVGVDNCQYSEKLGAFDTVDIDGTAVPSVAFVMGWRWAVAERAWVCGITEA